jgi:hypothetical protein
MERYPRVMQYQQHGIKKADKCQDILKPDGKNIRYQIYSILLQVDCHGSTVTQRPRDRKDVKACKRAIVILLSFGTRFHFSEKRVVR